MNRTTNCLKKLDRMNKTLGHQEADREQVSLGASAIISHLF